MIKKTLYIFCLFLVSNCTMSGTALVGPAFTGARTGSIYQSSLSYSSTKVLNHLKTQKITNNSLANKTLRNINPILPDIPFSDKDPVIIMAYKVDFIEYSEVIEPEPMP